MFKRKDSIKDIVNSLEREVKRLSQKYDGLLNNYEFLADKVDYIIVKAHCPVCGSEMRLGHDMVKDHWGMIRRNEYYLTCPKDNYTVVAQTLKGVFDKIPKKD